MNLTDFCKKLMIVWDDFALPVCCTNVLHAVTLQCDTLDPLDILVTDEKIQEKPLEPLQVFFFEGLYF